MDGATGEEISFQGVTDKVIMKYIPEQGQGIASHIANEGLFWLVTDVLGIVAATSLKWAHCLGSLAWRKKKCSSRDHYSSQIYAKPV